MEHYDKGVDTSVGGLVWVRRRNGSWWPGRILGLDELPAKCLISPTSGTPIQLLGSEHGSVDWYNIEKSKRVKAFRCGEYDLCIERAKASAVHSDKKPADAGKYVRREDAILHALELEMACFPNRNQRTNDSITTEKILAMQPNTYRHNKELACMDRTLSILGNSTQELSQSVVSFDRPDKQASSDMHMERKRWRTPNDSEDDPTEGIKRMRDLQELGLGIVLKRKPNIHFQNSGSHELALPDIASLSESNFHNGSPSCSPINSIEDSCTSLKRRRSQAIQVYEKSKKKICRRPLTKVKFQSYCHQGAIGQSSLKGLAQNKVKAFKSTSKKAEWSSAIDTPDCSGTSCEEALPYTLESTHNRLIGGTHFHSAMKHNEYSSMLKSFDNDCSDGFISVPVVMERKDDAEKLSENHCIQVGIVSHMDEGLGETGSTGSATQINIVRQRRNKGTSELYSKGRRKLRYQSLNRNTDSESFVNTCLMNRTEKETVNSISDESPTSDNSGQLVKCCSASEVGDVPQDQTPKLASKAVLISTVPCQVSDPCHHIRLPACSRYRAFELVSRIFKDSHLYDVKLNVQSSYQRVPLVSLTSKLNGKAIIGHPITVEVLGKLPPEVDSMVRSYLLKTKSTHRMKSAFSPRKVRSLSSITVDNRKDKEYVRKALVEKIGGPTISCVPLTLVFSRLIEALSSSASPAN